ncbi:MAG: BamA/TamA family outer membrane protein, partial [Bacteroidota bacterium]
DGFRSPEEFNEPFDSVGTRVSADPSPIASSPRHLRWSWRDREHSDGSKFARFGIPRNVSWLDERTKLPDGIFRYNRVEGLFLGMGSEKRYYWNSGRDLSAYGSVGYAFKVHRWWGTVGLARQVALGESSGQLLEVGLEAFDDPDSKDLWLIGSLENSMAALLMREDFRDLYERRGGSIHAAYYLRTDELFGEGSLTFRVERQSSLEGRVSWSIFGGDKRFRPNPAIDDGVLRSIVVRGGFSTDKDTRIARDGWDLLATGEFAGRGLGGDFSFEQYILDARRHILLGRYDNIGVRLRIGTGHGTLPLQRSFALGGLGTLPGFSFKEFSGMDFRANRMLLLNAEYIVNGGALHDLNFWPRFLFRHMNLFFFTDAGIVREESEIASPLSGFGGIKWNEWRTDIGLGICSTNGNFRIGAAWRTDHAEPARLYLRMASPF